MIEMKDSIIMPDGTQRVIGKAYTFHEYTDLFNKVGQALSNGESINAIDNILSGDYGVPDFVKVFMRAKFHVYHLDYQTALPLIENVLCRVEAKDISPVSFVPQEHDILRDIYGLAGEVFANCDKHAEALIAYQDYQLVLSRIKSDDSYSNNLLSFRKFNVFALQDLINDTITVCSPSVMNDPYDTLLLKWGEYVKMNKSGKKHTRDLCKSFESYRIRSFCKIYDEKNQPTVSNILMWSHYADEHRGICIEYQFDKAFLATEERKTIRMKDIIYRRKEEGFNLETNSINTNEALCYKLNDWEYENEVRLITYIPDESGPFVSIPMNSLVRINSIYFGYRCPDVTIKTVKSILSKYPDVRYYRMQSDYSSIYSLDAKPLSFV